MNVFRHVLALLAVTLPLLASAGEALVIGVFPRKPAAETRAAYEPLAKRLAAATRQPFEVRTYPSYAAFWEAVQKRQVDLVHYSQYYYLKSHKELGYDAILVNEESGSSRLSAAFAVRADSGLKSVADLKGKKILFAGSKQAMQGYIGQVQLLRAAGLRDGDYEEAFAVNTPNALIGTFNKAADAAAIGDLLLEHQSVKKRIDTSQMRILARTEPLPGLAWAVKRELDPALVKAIVKAMAGLREDPGGKAILEGAEVTAFVPVADKEFDVVRKVVKDATGEQY